MRDGEGERRAVRAREMWTTG